MADNRVPTMDDYRNHEPQSKWAWSSLSEAWTCPSCGRTKFELMRWKQTKRGWRWVAEIYQHHDHWSTPWRFDWTAVCCQCNSICSRVKEWWPGLVDQQYTYTPAQMRVIIVGVEPHGGVHIDLGVALDVYLIEVGEVYALPPDSEYIEKLRRVCQV